ncbi:N-acetyltransferase [Flavobacterium columnare]|uniref:Acetyltransferase n=2 Tax=Flavobacterium columnare TaxID=996 RepID=G8X558_FLACA|nr:GNAT family N-acetyltransferase [Flavobacterium columnare]AEW85469.1 acetyltransferase [Flavobacterium columnare ATCC 49512]ANO49335.1 acetyltransferase [Flavobacterium columnare]APT22687.1 N-acetyltransferase [Flavobacterium columnare]AUX18081.1 hypothetical protein AQ623_07235 [Flavobacterium columnare]MBF6651709.1 N-acetyltransferase [Flavobacterium columnare]
MLGAIHEVGIQEFDKVESIILKSGLVLDEFLGGGNGPLPLLQYKLERNQCKIYIYKIDTQIVGFILLLTKRSIISKLAYDWHIAYLYVDESMRRKKIGEALLDHTIQFASSTKANELSLYTTKDNFSAIKLYKKKGFLESNFLANYLTFKLFLNSYR